MNIAKKRIMLKRTYMNEKKIVIDQDICDKIE